MVFDVFDKKEKQFWNVKRRNELLQETTIPVVRQLHQGPIIKPQIEAMINQTSAFYDGLVEGIYLRVDGPDFLLDRAKVVRGDFLETEDDGTVEHWSKKKFVKNIVAW